MQGRREVLVSRRREVLVSRRRLVFVSRRRLVILGAHKISPDRAPELNKRVPLILGALWSARSESIENVKADFRHFAQTWCPARADISRVIMGRVCHFRQINLT